MKTILSIMQAMMYNLLPADLAMPVVMILRTLIPLVAIVGYRIVLYVMIYSQALNRAMTRSLQQASQLSVKELIISKYRN